MWHLTHKIFVVYEWKPCKCKPVAQLVHFISRPHWHVPRDACLATRWRCEAHWRDPVASLRLLFSTPPLLWVIREAMTHETLLLLLCRPLWPGFAEQLTVNWPFSSTNHLIVSAASRIIPHDQPALPCAEMLLSQTFYRRPLVTVV